MPYTAESAFVNTFLITRRSVIKNHLPLRTLISSVRPTGDHQIFNNSACGSVYKLFLFWSSTCPQVLWSRELTRQPNTGRTHDAHLPEWENWYHNKAGRQRRSHGCSREDGLWQRGWATALGLLTLWGSEQRSYTPEQYETINKAVDELLAKNSINRKTASDLKQSRLRIASCYLLPKVHKSLSSPPGRPIVSSNGCPTELTSFFVDTILKPLVINVVSFIRDTKRLLSEILALP